MIKSQTKLTWVLIAILALLSLSPVVMLMLGSFSKGLVQLGDFTLDKYKAVYGDISFYGILGDTLVFVFFSALFSTVLALFLAYLNNRTDIPGKFLFRIISVVPMMIPHVLFAVSWSLLLNPSNGILNLIFTQVFKMAESPMNIYSIGGMILVEGLLDLPIAYLIISPAMASFDVSLEESSRVSGAGNIKTLFRITLPVLRPAILAAFILCIVRCLASFAVPSVLGMPANITVLATYIYKITTTGLIPDYGKAAATGMSILALSISLIYVYRYMTRSSEKFITVSSRGFKPSVVKLKGAKVPLFIVLIILMFILIVLPVLVLLYTSLVPYSMVPSAKAFSMMSLAHWKDVFTDSISLVSLKNSLFLSLVGATLGTILSIFVSYVIVKVKTRSAGLLESLSFLSFSFPGIVIAIGFMWLFVRTPLYATIWALLIGYIATYLPYGIRPMTSAFIQIHSSLEESSKVCGASFLTTVRRIIVPLLVSGIVSGWVLMATMFFRELSLSVVLSRPGTETLAVMILKFSDDGLWGKLSALGIIMIFISTLMVVGANLIGNKFRPEAN